MNEVVNKFSKNLMNSFFKDESKNKLTRHRKIYNLKLEYMNQYKPSIKSLRNAYLKEENRRRNRLKLPDDKLQDTFTQSFIVHKQSNSSNFVDKHSFYRKSPIKISQDSFHYFEVTNPEKKRSKLELDSQKLQNFRVFSKNSLISPKLAYAVSPKMNMAQLMLMKRSKQVQSCKHEQEVKKNEIKRVKKFVPISFSPVRPLMHLKRVSELTLKGWDKYPSQETFLLNSENS